MLRYATQDVDNLDTEPSAMPARTARGELIRDEAAAMNQLRPLETNDGRVDSADVAS